ncbi:unnamed protein product [Schistosoma mattheei]|uniref:Uncharacterized protein n=1 Tax=Schistosoma mattheei TaxID=31246 RepID=A0A3P8ART6_9TREM|nr:unnamed protein product [Schistosoma mattheei]
MFRHFLIVRGVVYLPNVEMCIGIWLLLVFSILFSKEFSQTLSANRSNVPLNCPLIGCSGIGHINGRDTAHVTLSGCPLYHNMSFVKWAEMRAREEGLVVPESIRRISQNSPSPSKVKHRVDRSHQFKTTQREPMLDDLASQVELYQFRRAQQRLVSTYVSI